MMKDVSVFNLIAISLIGYEEFNNNIMYNKLYFQKIQNSLFMYGLNVRIVN